MDEAPVVKRGPGRPKKIAVEREPVREPVQTKKWNMRAAPNWETVDPLDRETPDRLFIDPSWIPQGMSLQWVTSEIFGQSQAQRRGMFERTGWTPVHQGDFDGQFDGRFMPKGREGEINVDGLVLMARPKAMTDKAQVLENRKAYEQVAIKEQALRGGDIPITLDARHASATRSNKISKTVERIEIPE